MSKGKIEALKGYGIEKWFIEKVSAKDTNRPKLQEMLSFVRGGNDLVADTIFVLSFDRLARSTKDLLYIVEFLDKKGVSLVSVKENFNTSTPTGRLLLTMIAAINAFERENLLERQREGIQLAKQLGKYKGSTAKKVKDIATHYDRYMKREVSKVQLAKELKISRPTLDKLFNEYIEKTTTAV
ncbi:MAG: recombinase family protein [Bacillaceae bacterium]|nr:recombinase family protein [Bacillaceae bacterium]